MTDSKQEEKLIKKSDIILVAVIIIIAVIGFIYIMLTKKPGATVKLSVDGNVVESFDINEDMEYQLTTDQGVNIVTIKNGVVDVVEADCPDKVCVKHMPIKNAGETIICLPHRLVVEIVE